MAIEHVVITDPEIHEPKDISTASVDTVYTADGAGSGTWQLITPDNLDPAEFPIPNLFFICASMDDLSTASTIYVPVPVDCTCDIITATIQTAITVADATLTFSNNAGAVMDTQVIPFTASAAGNTTQTTIGANRIFVAGTKLQITTDGGSTTASRVNFAIQFTAT